MGLPSVLVLLRAKAIRQLALYPLSSQLLPTKWLMN